MSAKGVNLNARTLRSEDLLIVIDSEIEERGLAGHHLESFNSFISTGINQIVTQLFEVDKTLQNERNKTPEDQQIALINFKVKFTDVHVGRPVSQLHRSGRQDALWPNMARRNDMNYSSPVSIDMQVTARAFLHSGEELEPRVEEVKGVTAFLPVMVGSQACNTVDMTPEALRRIDEDPKDKGGYFIIRGGEWVINMIESRLFNAPHIFHNVGHEREIARLEYISKPGDAYENSSELVMKYVTNGNIYLNFTSNTYLKSLHLPFYILFRLYGMTTDKEITDSVVYGYSLPEHQDVVSDYMVQVIKRAFKASDPSFQEAREVTDQAQLLKLFAQKIVEAIQPKGFTQKEQNLESQTKYLHANLLKLLDKHVFPHVGLGADSRHRKLRFLGHLIHKLLLVEMNIVPSTDRDSLKNKRIAAAGRAYAKVFKTHFNLEVVQTIKKKLTKEFKNSSFSQVNLKSAVMSAIRAPDLEKAIIQAIATGNKEITVKNRQVPNRLASEILHRKNQLNFLATLRVIRTPSSSANKQDQRADEMRRVHSSYTRCICPIQSADSGEQVGMVKQMAMGASISEASSSELLKETLLSDPDVLPLARVFPEQIHRYHLCKVFVNGDWIGCTPKGPQIVRRYREVRRGYRLQTAGKKEKKKNSLSVDQWEFTGESEIDPMTTIYWDTEANEIQFWVDAGRFLFPMLVVRNNGELDSIGRTLIGMDYDPWKDPSVELDQETGFPRVKEGSFVQDIVLSREDVKKLFQRKLSIRELHKRGIVDYITPEELENCLVAPSLDDLKVNQTNPLLQYTHCEIPAGLIGLPAQTCPFASRNQAPRLTFQTNQGKQTGGWYSLNWAHRTDKHAFLQYYCEVPIIKTIANRYVYPNGANKIVAIASYRGYNQEDSLISNKSSSQRGLFKGNQYNFVKAVLEKNERFGNPNEANTMDINKHANYEHLVEGFVPLRTRIQRDDVIIGKNIELPKPVENYHYRDTSVLYNSNEPAMVEDVVRGRNQEGEEFVKVKFSSVREYDNGDKFSCFKPTAELLTLEGWKRVCEISVEDRLATLRGGELHYSPPIGFFEYNFKGELVTITTPEVHVVCTSNHRLWVKTSSEGTPEFLEAGMAVKASMGFSATALWKGEEISVPEGSAPVEHARNAALWMLETGRRKLPDWVWKLPREAARVFLATLSSPEEKGGFLVPGGSDEFTRLALHAGWSALQTPEGGVKVLLREETWAGPEHSSREFYEGRVMCVEVPEGRVYYRETPLSPPCWIGNSRHGQKGMVGITYNQADMLFTEGGIIPDSILSPFAIPSRMTIGQLIEGQAAKLAAIEGAFSDATIFRHVDVVAIGDQLEKYGYDRHGVERVYNGFTGEWIETEIFIAPCYYQRLQKFVVDEVYAISTGPTCVLTRQPLEGKSNRGGLRVGEMERDGLVSHGTGHFLMEKFRDDSDGFDVYVCRTCKRTPVVNESKGIIICRTCESAGLDPDVVRVNSTWSSKLFLQELESAGVGVNQSIEPWEYEVQL